MSGILGGPIDGPSRTARAYPRIEARVGLAVVHRGSRFRGQVCGFEGEAVRLRGQSSDERLFRLAPGGFIVGADVVTLVRPAPGPAAASVTASGSVARPGTPARAAVARSSRIWVEGLHDAALVEKVWGDDLRELAIVVEPLDGIDNLAAEVARFRPNEQRRLGVLVDHLVSGSKEARIAAEVVGPFVAVRGTPYIDVWQAVRPQVVGISAWPVVPKGEEWKAGVCRRLGVGEAPAFWRRILSSVGTYADLEASFVGAVEALIDHVTTE